MMNEQEWRMANKAFCLMMGSGTEKQRKKLQYEMEHFRSRLRKQGKDIEYTFHYEGPSVVVAHIFEGGTR